MVLLSHPITHSTFYTTKRLHHRSALHQSHPISNTNPFTKRALTTKSPIFVSFGHRFIRSARYTSDKPLLPSLTSNDDDDAGNPIQTSNSDETKERAQEKNFWGAVGLIIGTAVGPGMLGLPAATIKSGPLPSTIAILSSAAYVFSSIVLVAELSFATMEEDGVPEVSFTGLATRSLGNRFGGFVALVYASLSFSLLVACVSGIGSIVSQWFPWMSPVMSNTLFPISVGAVIALFPFKAIDYVNRFLCLLMLVSLTALVAIGSSKARTNLMDSFLFGRASWSLSSILPAIPVTVLTLGFHVVTPFICKIAGNTVSEARKAILVGGAVPLMMVLSWNLIVLGLVGTSPVSASDNPISLLLSVNSSALPAVQGFAFFALSTSLIGYVVSLPKQIADTFDLIFGKKVSKQQASLSTMIFSDGDSSARVGFAIYSGVHGIGNSGEVLFGGSRGIATSAGKQVSGRNMSDQYKKITMLLSLGIPVLLATFLRSTFSRALDFAGVYANCFLFGILPPIMTYIYQCRKELRPSILPGGDATLLLLLVIAVILAIWH